MHTRWLRLSSARVLCMAIVLTAATMAVPPLVRTYAQTWTALASSATCSQLAGIDRTATNSSEWGRTLLPGHGASGGWFGVDICGNGINTVAPGGANVSCDRIPSNISRTGCAPGQATYDGFGLSFQCVELVVRFSAWAYGDQPSGWRGDAQYLWLPGNHPSDFSAHPNGSSQGPVAGDMLVWGTADAQGNPWPAGPAGGHVAVVASVQGGNLTFVEENALSGQLNVPRETTSLLHQGGRWIVGGSLVTHAGTRMLYGWLHSWKNTGKFTGSGAVHGTPPATNSTAPTSTDPSVQLPSITPSTLSTSVAVTADGALADLSWPQVGGSGGAATPAAAPRSLGAPAGVSLAPDQVPAVMVMSDGTRDMYVRGDNGQLYVARTLPQTLGVTWRSLGAPDGVRLTGSVAASNIPGGLSLGALGDDGSLWWRGGPAGNLGSWVSVGHPSTTHLHGAALLATEAGSGLPMALALGRDGRLYETFWSNGSGAGDPGGWGQWTEITLPTRSNALLPPLLAIAEPAAGHDRIGTWPDVPLDVFVADTGGTLWMLHLGQQEFWRTTTLAAPPGLKGLIGGVALASLASDAAKTAAPAGSAYHLYAADASGVALGALQLDAAGIIRSIQWTPLAQPPADGSLPVPGNAVGLTSDQSVLISGQGPSMQLTGTRQALSLLGAAPSTGDVALTNAMPGPATFGDSFDGPVLDPRWQATGSSAPPTVSGGVVYLDPPARQGLATLLQGAPTGNFSIATRVMLPPAQPPDIPDIQVGLILTLDGGNWLTFGVDRHGVTSLCASAWWQASPCQHANPGLDGASGRSLFLRVTRAGDAFIALASHDGSVWTVAGKWTASTPGSGSANPAGSSATVTPTATARATTTPAASAARASIALPASAPLAFTAAGLFAQASGPLPAGTPAQAWPLFLYYDVGPSPAGN